MEENVKLIQLGLRIMNISLQKSTIEKILRLYNRTNGDKELTIQDAIEIENLVDKNKTL